MDGFGLTGYASMPSSGFVGITSASVRVFDFCMGTTGGSGLASATLFDYSDGATAYPIISVGAGSSGQLQNWASNAGIRFPGGCFCVVRGTTATVNYIKEL